MAIINKLILASASPRRSEILKNIGLEFTVMPSKAEEPRISDPSLITSVSEFKARDVYAQLNQNSSLQLQAQKRDYGHVFAILSADTIVYLDKEILGKPKNQQEAQEMLTKLSGKTHKVATAITLMKSDGSYHSAIETTTVKFRPITQQEIMNYIENYKPYDKAGAYAIQEPASLFIERIEGCYSNVVGLPVTLLLKELANL